jgi:hypothetical protein
LVFGFPYSQDGPLTMNTFLSERVMFRQFNVNGEELAYGGQGMHNVPAMPRDKDTAPADIFSTHCTVRPDSRRCNVARQLYLDPWILTLIDVLHGPTVITGLYLLASGTSIPKLAYSPNGN